MGKGFNHALSRGAFRGHAFPVQYIPVDTTITVDGAAGVGFGSVSLGRFGREGGVSLLLGGAAKLQFTGPGSGDLTDDWEGDFSIGSAATADASLSGDEVNIVQSTAIAAATAEVSPVTTGFMSSGSAGRHFSTSNPVGVTLNMLIDDADISADGIVLAVKGVVALHIVYLLDE